MQTMLKKKNLQTKPNRVIYKCIYTVNLTRVLNNEMEIQHIVRFISRDKLGINKIVNFIRKL